MEDCGWELDALRYLLTCGGVYSVARVCAIAAHEYAHVFGACALRRGDGALTFDNLVVGALFKHRVNVPLVTHDATTKESRRSDAWIRHAGWLASTLLAGGVTLLQDESLPFELRAPVQLAFWLTALDAAASDLFQITPPDAASKASAHLSSSHSIFFCGNFGVILFNLFAQEECYNVLCKMTEITMMRGAQSGGVVTYLPDKAGGLRGSRSRSVNRKRTDLSLLVTNKLKADVNKRSFVCGLLKGPRVFSGHTRFATSSIANMEGTHPHQWCPPADRKVWVLSPSGVLQASVRNVENFITHNGDFEFFMLNGQLQTVEFVQEWLIKTLHCPMPSGTDSIAVAGMIDLFRTQGNWFASVRLASVVWTHVSGITDCPSLTPAACQRVANIFEAKTRAVTAPSWGGRAQFPPPPHTKPRLQEYYRLLREEITAGLAEELLDHAELSKHLKYMNLCGIMADRSAASQPEILSGHGESRHGSRHGLAKAFSTEKFNVFITDDEEEEEGEDKTEPFCLKDVVLFVKKAVDAFFDNDIMFAAHSFLLNAKGSFGLAITSSLDQEQMVVVARGQTMSLAVFPRKGLVLFGSEQAAVKSALGLVEDVDPSAREAYRVDLDDLGGEIVLIGWGQSHQTPEVLSAKFSDAVVSGVFQQHKLCNFEGAVVMASVWQQSLPSEFMRRAIPLEGNPLILRLPPTSKDPVGTDIRDIPKLTREIQELWGSDQGGNNTLNQLSIWTLARHLKRRIKMKKEGHGAVDLLITGQEVSLWAGEQFASDLAMVFPKLRIKTVSANKVLALMGLEFNSPSVGFQYNEESYDLKDTVVLIISHSGGTFSSLAVSNLLKSVTDSIFVVAGDWDTQISRALRQQTRMGSIESFVITTGAGIRPAEPVSLSLVATHLTLTQMLLYLMRYFVTFANDPQVQVALGASYTEHTVMELYTLSVSNCGAMRDITGYDVRGDRMETRTNQALFEQADVWANHILEAPIAWIISAVYVLGTVVSGYPVVYGLLSMAGVSDSPGEDLGGHWAWVKRAALFLDSLVYIFLPLWTTILLRLVQGRHWLHRLGTRSIVVGDIPWVSQSVDQFLSKLFARSFSIASVNVYSANPVDHLVHKFTHRVVRGTLLAVGRPDGRLNGLTAAENAASLAVNQASSIQHMGVTCESITIGHNNYRLPLTANHVVIPTNGRPEFLSERFLRTQLDKGVSAAGIIGLFAALKRPSDHAAPADQSLHSGMASLMRRKRFAMIRAESLMSTASPMKKGFFKTEIQHYFGADLQKQYPRETKIALMERQKLSQRLYESRIASLQRCVSFFVMFHHMAAKVQRFWPKVSFGLLDYEMDRTQSIMRIATTASPVSGMDVRDKILQLSLDRKRHKMFDNCQKVARRWREITRETVNERRREQSHAFRSSKARELQEEGLLQEGAVLPEDVVLQDGLLLQEMGVLLQEGSVAADTDSKGLNGKGNGVAAAAELPRRMTYADVLQQGTEEAENKQKKEKQDWELLVEQARKFREMRVKSWDYFIDPPSQSVRQDLRQNSYAGSYENSYVDSIEEEEEFEEQDSIEEHEVEEEQKKEEINIVVV